MLNWNDKEQIAWACEVIGVDYKGLPLTHHQKTRFLALAAKNPQLKYPGSKQRGNMFQKPNPPKTETVLDSASAEDTLITQYNRELESIRSRKEKYKQLLVELDVEAKTLTKKRSAVMKALGIIENT